MSDLTLTWNCSKCGAKNLQGDVCPFCGAFNDAPKGNTKYKTPTPAAAPNYNTAYQDFTSTSWVSSLQTPVTSDSFSAVPASVPMIIPQEGPVTSDDFFASGKKPFLLNRGNEGIVEGRSRHIARSWSAYTVPLIFLVIMFAVTLMTLPNYQLVTALESRGRSVTGAVANKRYTVSTGKSRSTTYYLAYTYTVAGKSYRIEQSVSSGIYNMNNVGGQVTVSYLPENPAQARLGGDDKDDGGIISGFYGTVAGWVAFAITCIFCLNHILRNLRLATQGQLVTGRVIGAHMSRNKNSYTLALTYAFKSPTTGKTLQRKESRGRNVLKLKGAPAYGIPVRVLYVDDKTYRVM